MQNTKTKVFIKRLKENGFYPQRAEGSHTVFVNKDGRHISIPTSHKEIQGVITARLVKENKLK